VHTLPSSRFGGFNFTYVFFADGTFAFGDTVDLATLAWNAHAKLVERETHFNVGAQTRVVEQMRTLQQRGVAGPIRERSDFVLAYDAEFVFLGLHLRPSATDVFESVEGLELFVAALEDHEHFQQVLLQEKVGDVAQPVQLQHREVVQHTHHQTYRYHDLLVFGEVFDLHEPQDVQVQVGLL